MASENSYAQLIDDYENGVQVIEGESFDEYQKRMGGIDYNAYGGLTGMGYKNGGGIGSMMKSKKVPQLVTPSKDGSRPGYRGDAAYGRSSRSNQATSIGQAQGATGPGGGASLGGGRDRNEQPATTRIGGKTYNVTPENRGQRDRAELLSSLNRTMPKGATGNLFSNFNKAVNPLKVMASFAKRNPIGILASMFGNINNPFKGRGFNPDGTKRTQQEYEDARTNRQYVKRLDKMYARKDAKKGDRLYGKNFSQKNIDMIEGLGYNRSGAPEGILASENLNGIVSNNTENLKPKANITGPQYNLDNFGTGIRPSGPGYGLSGFQQPSTITGGMAPNDYEIDGTVDGITNYGFDQEDGITNYDFDQEDGITNYDFDQEDGITNYNFDPEVLVNRQNEFATPETMNQNAMEQDAGMYSGLPNQKLTNDAAMSVMMEAYNNSLPPPDNYNIGTEFGLQPTEGFENPNALYDDDNSAVSYYPEGNKLISSNNIINSDIAPQFQDSVSRVGINEAQKSLIDQAASNAQASDTAIPAGIYDQAKGLDTKAKSGFLGFGKQEADPMTSAEYKNYLVSQGYI